MVAPRALPRIDAYAVPPHEHQRARDAVGRMVEQVYRETVTECAAAETTLSREIWKWLWCEIVAQLVLLGKVDEELDDVLRLCIDPSFHPPGSPSYRPQKEPPKPRSTAGTSGRPRIRALRSRDELSSVGLLRLMEGTVAGAPIRAPVSHLVVFAFDPEWGGITQSRTDLGQLAAANPGVSFAVVSLADTRRHFGKPANLGEIAWVLAAAGPDGRVFPAPIVGRTETKPSLDQWMKIIGHARGSKSSGPSTIVRPRQFGDLVRWMLTQRRPRSTTAMKTRAALPRRPRRPRGFGARRTR
ncbi:MAG: hypothetical protein AB1Z98_02230 [Nannocystaceae bacterium]